MATEVSKPTSRPPDEAAAPSEPAGRESSPPRDRCIRLGDVVAFCTAAVMHAALLVLLAVLQLTRDQDPLPPITAAYAEAEPLEVLEILTSELELERPVAEITELPQTAPPEMTLTQTDIGGSRWESELSPLSRTLDSIALMGTLPAEKAEAPGDGFSHYGEGDYSHGFRELVGGMRQKGLEVILVFDSTGSMHGEINVVKQRMLQIGGALIRKIPGTRIGICTYRDYSERFVADGLPLTSNIQQVHQSLLGITAEGGGDTPEAVHEGLFWAMTNNQFRPNAHKVILLFGDAPPRETERAKSFMLAKQFHEQQGGIVSTITCRRGRPLPEFREIARLGGGEAFIIRDYREVMQELLVLLFGAEHRQDVVRFFGLKPTSGAAPGREDSRAGRR